MSGRLDGKACLITGAGSGIGRATALRYAQEGAAVAVADVSRESADETVATIAVGLGCRRRGRVRHGVHGRRDRRGARARRWWRR